MRALALILLFCGNCFIGNAQDDDCVFDLKSQSNDFLQDTEFWEIHTWNNDSKTARIKLSDNLSLKIVRGGCAHFNYYVSVEVLNDETPLDDFDYWSNMIKTYTHMLPDFDNEYVDSLLQTSPEFEEKSTDHKICFFRQDRYCNVEFYLKREGKKTSIDLGYYRC